jgi:hypothetical protein
MSEFKILSINSLPFNPEKISFDGDSFLQYEKFLSPFSSVAIEYRPGGLFPSLQM